MSIEEKGTLPVGIEWNGSRQKEFDLRPLTAGDVIGVGESAHAARAEKSDQFRSLCYYAARLTKLGDIPKEEITPELLLGMYDVDLGELMAAEGRLSQRLATF